MQNKAQKKELVKDLAQKIKESKSVVFADFKGVKVKDLTELKKELRKEGISFKVLKKTLINIALKEAGVEASTKEMEGQVAISTSPKDEVAPAKIISKFSKANENIKILGGVLESKSMTIKFENLTVEQSDVVIRIVREMFTFYIKEEIESIMLDFSFISISNISILC